MGFNSAFKGLNFLIRVYASRNIFLQRVLEAFSVKLFLPFILCCHADSQTNQIVFKYQHYSFRNVLHARFCILILFWHYCNAGVPYYSALLEFIAEGWLLRVYYLFHTQIGCFFLLLGHGVNPDFVPKSTQCCATDGAQKPGSSKWNASLLEPYRINSI